MSASAACVQEPGGLAVILAGRPAHDRLSVGQLPRKISIPIRARLNEFTLGRDEID
jgi:hypothetical protein